LLLRGMFEKLFGDSLRMDALSHIVVALVAQDADDLRRQRLIQYSQNDFAVAFVTAGDCPVLNMLTRAGGFR
jgi:hypothetical protein